MRTEKKRAVRYVFQRKWRNGEYQEQGRENPLGWTKEQEIRWVEQRVREREVIENEQAEGKPDHQRQHPDWCKTGEYTRVDYLAWLFTVRDELSFQDVGEKLFAKDQTPNGRKMRAYRAWERVEREFHRGPLKRRHKPTTLSDLILASLSLTAR